MPPFAIYPETEQEIQEIIRDGLQSKMSFGIWGRQSKPGWGGDVKSDKELYLDRLSGISSYEPEEMLITAKAGTSLGEIESALAARGQCLAFEPPDYSRFYDRDTSDGSIGGAIACNLSGPRRLLAGAARDHFLAFRAISGRGELFQSGGKVMKNVTGYDLCKIMAGSQGTLAAMTEVTVKTMPRPPMTVSLLIAGIDLEPALQLLEKALQQPLQLSGATYISRSAISYCQLPSLPIDPEPILAFRLEGRHVSIEERFQSLRKILPLGAFQEIQLEPEESQAFWQQLRDLTWLQSSHSEMVWRVTHPLTHLAVFIPMVFGTPEACSYIIDHGGMTSWLVIPEPPARVNAANIYDERQALRDILHSQGPARCIKGSRAARAFFNVWPTDHLSLLGLQKALKAQFDPGNILNPDRLWRG